MVYSISLFSVIDPSWEEAAFHLLRRAPTKVTEAVASERCRARQTGRQGIAASDGIVQ